MIKHVSKAKNCISLYVNQLEQNQAKEEVKALAETFLYDFYQLQKQYLHCHKQFNGNIE